MKVPTLCTSHTLMCLLIIQSTNRLPKLMAGNSFPLTKRGWGLTQTTINKLLRRGGEYPWGSPGAWIRDTEVWGEGPYEQIPWLATKKIRLTQYASVAMIHETFAEFYMASVLYPEYLTKEEGAYFGRLHEGLKKDAKAFLKQIAKNPDILRIS